MSDKIYLNGLIIKEHKFDNGDSILKVTMIVEDFAKGVRDNMKDNVLRFNIKKAREPFGKNKDITHYCEVDTFVPDKNYKRAEPKQEEVEEKFPF